MTTTMVCGELEGREVVIGGDLSVSLLIQAILAYRHFIICFASSTDNRGHFPA